MLSYILDILIIIILIFTNMFMYWNIKRIELLYKSIDKSTSKSISGSRLRYNPADLFNPYKYEKEELDPVIPEDIMDSLKSKLTKKKTEY